jgi:simple sugar transport system permease protein
LIKGSLEQFFTSVLAVFIGLLIGAIILWITGYNPLTAYGLLAKSSLGDYHSIIETLNAMTPIIFTGLAAAVMFKSALFFIGMEGQLYVGALFAFIAGYMIQLPPIIHMAIALLAGGLGGLLWGLGPGYLKAKFGVNETVISIMLNWVAIYLTDYVVLYVFPDPKATITRTYKISPTAVLPRISSNLPLNWSFILAVLTAILTGFILYKTTTGYEMRVVGFNPRAARVAKINVERVYLKTFLFSGFLAGLAGSSMILGVFNSIPYRFSPGYGWDGITAALIAQNNPYFVLISSLLLAVLRTGSFGMMVGIGVSSDLILVIQGVVLVAASTPGAYSLITRYLKSWRGVKT